MSQDALTKCLKCGKHGLNRVPQGFSINTGIGSVSAKENTTSEIAWMEGNARRNLEQPEVKEKILSGEWKYAQNGSPDSAVPDYLK